MKFSTSVGFVAAAASVAALPAQDSVAARIAGASPLTWRGVVHPNEAPVTLQGTAKEIYETIVSMNPNYDEQLGITSVSSTKSVEVDSLQKRLAPTSSDYTCAYGNYVNALPIAEDIKYLYSIGNADCVAPAGQPGAGGCSRVSCNSNAGVWLCNDQNFETHIPCTLIADNAVEILIKCQYTTYANGVWDSFVRGQIFSTDRSWNTIVNSAGGSC
ncbi:hypothetical protein GQ53DRAFT_742481 [Thozetella sp. PMI_491]|nr:hypothetical protein GQ53DRAFT_742481 [Thozetella sp. PMI_491]